jgi:regulator of protease activity HflC (stomatin/prohibitin superfamily)
MKALAERPIHVERPARTFCGAPIMALNLATCVTIPFILVDGARMAEWPTVLGGVVVLVAMFFMWRGFFTVGPNDSYLLLAWGEYRGTVRDAGYHWVGPFVRKIPMSLRARTVSIDRLKVHDITGAPIEMAAVITWRVTETARAALDVNSVEDFVRDHCDSAVRHLAANIHEPIGEDLSALRRAITELQINLRATLQERVNRAGVTIDEVRLTQRCEKWAPVRATSAVEAA